MGNESAPKKQTVAVLGASPNPERYANRAVRRLLAEGHRVIPVNPAEERIEGIPAARSLGEIGSAVDTLTVYLNPERSRALIPDVLALRPGRVILNPGAEFPELMAALDAAGIPHEEACTLVLLSTKRF